MQTNQIPARADVPTQDKWAIQDLFATDDDWRAALTAAKEYVPRITAYRGRLGESGATLLAFLRLDDEISLAFDPLVHYAQRKSDEDTRGTTAAWSTRWSSGAATPSMTTTSTP